MWDKLMELNAYLSYNMELGFLFIIGFFFFIFLVFSFIFWFPEIKEAAKRIFRNAKRKMRDRLMWLNACCRQNFLAVCIFIIAFFVFLFNLAVS